MSTSNATVITKAEIAARSGVAVKTVSRWFAKHEWLSEVPPDVLVQFFKQEPDEKRLWLEQYESEYSSAPVPPPSPASTDSPSPQTPPPLEGYAPKFPPDWSEGSGLRREVWRLETACMVMAKEVQRLACCGHKDLARAQKAYADWLGQWRQLAKDAPKALTELNDSISKVEAQAAWMETLSAVAKLMDNMPVRLARLICGVSVPEGIERATREIRGIKSKLAKGMGIDRALELAPLELLPIEPKPKPVTKPLKKARSTKGKKK